MPTPRPANRSYSTESLEHWFAALPEDWEKTFNKKDLAEGRRLYAEGAVRSLELRVDAAEAVSKTETLTVRAVLEVAKGVLQWRTSLSEEFNGAPYAIASTYEVEELLADEIDPLGESLPPEPVAPEPEVKPAVSAVEVLRLQVTFELDSERLTLAGAWVGQGRKDQRCFGPGAIPAEELSDEQRQTLFRFNTVAHRAGFIYNKTAGTWDIDNIGRIERFVREELADWRRRFRLVGEECLTIFRNEQLQVAIDAEAESTADEPGGFRLAWRLKAGGHRLGAAEQKLLLKAGGRPIILPGKGVVAYNAAVADFSEDWRGKDGSIPRYLLLSLFDHAAVGALRLNEDLKTWKDALLREPPEPEGAPDYLRPYQARGVAWLARMCELGAHPLLADEMGLGKTVQVLSLLATRPGTGPSLIVCPASVIPVWMAEFARFQPSVTPAVLTADHDFSKDPAPQVWISSYTQLRRHAKLLPTARFTYAVLDEAQAIKNPDSKTTQACQEILADHRIAITGTPLENRPLDLWTLFRFLMPGLLGKRAAFERMVARDASAALGRVRRQVSPFILRRLKRDVAADIPAKVESILPCPLTAEQRRLYAGLTEGSGLSGDLGGLLRKDATSVLTLLMRLRQVCCDPGLLPDNSKSDLAHSAKISILMSKLAEATANGSKAVVFSQFVSLLERVKRAMAAQLPRVPIFELTGETKDRATPVESFRQAPGAAIFLASLKAGGTGITLNTAEYVFLLDPWWNPAVEAQAVDRVHRIGQRNSVLIYRMIAPGTVEERIEALKHDKRELFAKLVGDLPDMTDWTRHFASLDALVRLSDAPAASAAASEELSEDAASHPEGGETA